MLLARTNNKMDTVKNIPICKDCQFSSLLFCNKYQKECLSFSYDKHRYQIPCIECLDAVITDEKEIPSQTMLPSKEALFHIPDPYRLNLIFMLLDFQKLYPDAFYENRKIYEIYGSFVGAIWNGRTPLFKCPFLSIQAINKIKTKIEERNLRLNLTWNNSCITEKDLSDSYCNNITELFHNGKHCITVASDTLYYYLKNKYPNFTYYKSVINTSNNNNFDIIINNPKDNNNWDLLNQIPEEKRNKVEFLCNDNCFPFCNKNYHYNIINTCLRQNCAEPENFNHCLIDHDFSFYNTARWPNTITPDKIDLYLQNNFIHFKLTGRDEPNEILLYKLCKYFIKDKFFEDIYFSILFQLK